MPAISRVSGTAPTAIAIQSPTVIPTKSATPPSSGVGRSCQRSADGAATSRAARVDRRSAQAASAAAGKAARAARVLTCGEGSGAVLGLCLPAERVPRLIREDDGLRRSAALPRALRESFPARFPGQVQGLAARRPVVAAEPARAPRRLPRRVRAALERRDDSPLPALPPRRARLLDLLRDVAAGRGAFARRLRRADQKGAVPAPARRVLDGRDAGGDVRGDGRDPARPLARLHPRGALD